MLRFLHSILPKRLKSGTEKYPKPTDVFNALTDDVLNLSELDKAFFWAKRCKGWAEVHLHRGDILVSFKFTHKKSLETIFTEKGIEIPEGWWLKYFKKKKRAEFRLSKSRKDTIGSLLDSVFRKLYGCPDNYRIYGKLILAFWQIE